MHDMNRRAVIALVLTGAMGWVGFGIGWAIVGGYLPGTDPTASAQAITDFYTRDLLSIRIGLMLAVFSLAFVLMWGVAVVMVSRRIERGFPAFSYVQLVAMALSNGFTLLCVIVWCVASYRAGEISPDITRTLHDFAWLMFELSWPPYFVWLLAIAIVILRDRSPHPLFPRWAGYLTIAEAMVNFLDSFLHIFKTGPLAYNGLYALWVTVFVFWAWAIVMTVLVIRAAKRPELSSTPEEGATSEDRGVLQPTA